MNRQSLPSMRLLALAGLLLGQTLLVGCQSAGDTASEVGRSATGGFVQSRDTYGTGRRVDVYGGTTAPSLPTIGAAGFGK